MLYVLFLVLAIAYNLMKFRKERTEFLTSLTQAQHISHRQMILGHHFTIFIFEGFISLIVAHLVTDKAKSIGILGLGAMYLSLVCFGFFLYRFFIRYVEKHTQLSLYEDFKNHLVKEMRVNFSLILLPILVYSVINWTFQDGGSEEVDGMWVISVVLNVIFVSVLTIACSVIIMLRLIPNREISEPEYLEIINKRLKQIHQTNIRIRWIESDIKNAFVVGLKLLTFSNQTMFIGRSLRTSLTMEEFDAVIAHELSHVANRHIHKRVIDLLKNFVSIFLGTLFISTVVLGGSMLYWGDDIFLHTTSTTLLLVVLCLGWMVVNYTILFDTIRSHEFEADGYAVIELGASFEAFKSALEKLTTTEELPQYLKAKTQKKKQKSFLGKWLTKTFSTHPDLSTRVSFLEYKMKKNLPFNYYLSAPQRMRRWLGHVLQWRISLPLTTGLAFAMIWGGWSLKQGMDTIEYLASSSPEMIMGNKKLIEKINSKPQFIGHTLMYYVVFKKDEKLIDHFLSNGADKGKTLLYLSQLKDAELFQKYYVRFQNDLSEDEYFLVLRKTASENFTEGYRLLVNAKRFEALDPSYKENVAKAYQQNKSRSPASVDK